MMDSETKTEPQTVHAEGSRAVLSAVPVTFQVMLGTATLKLADLMELRAGSEVALDQAIGEDVIILVNGARVAKGQLYVQDEGGEKLSVKITEVLGQAAE